MPYQPIDADPDPGAVERVTFVMFRSDRDCVAARRPGGGLCLVTAEVRAGENYLLDTSVRGPLEMAGFRMQRVHPFAADGPHVYAWIEGDGYRGRRPHPSVDLTAASAEQIAARLRTQGDSGSARIVADAARSYREQDEASYHADNVRLMQPAYLRGRTATEGSGFGGDATAWRQRRELIVDGIDRDGTFLDLGCANGLLMESVTDWAAERGYLIEAYGVDIAPRLVDLARERYPLWVGRIELGNAIDYRPHDGRRFTFVYLLPEFAPADRRRDLIGHALGTLVLPAGRLIVGHYGDHGTAVQDLAALGFTATGESRRPAATVAWIDANPVTAEPVTSDPVTSGQAE